MNEVRSPPPSLLWMLLPGAAGFLAGMFGPIIFDPEANQGPLLGVLVTGPGGALLGLLLGIGCRTFGIPPLRQWQSLTGACLVLVAGTLFLSLPGPGNRGEVIDAEILDCKPPAQALDRAMAFWEKRMAGASTRPGWQDEVRRAAQADSGVVLELRVARQFPLFEHRKPWNRGVIMSPGWRDVNLQKRYYTRHAGGSCASYPVGVRSLHYAYYPSAPSTGGAVELPPSMDLPRFLDLKVLIPVPDEYKALIGGQGAR